MKSLLKLSAATFAFLLVLFGISLYQIIVPSPIEREVTKAARAFILDYVKYPNDAEFPYKPSIISEQEGKDEYSVYSTMKLKNEFGATLTHDYSILM